MPQPGLNIMADTARRARIIGAVPAAARAGHGRHDGRQQIVPMQMATPEYP